MASICDFCGKEYSSKYTLKRHQTTSEFCLKGRNKEAVKEECKYCGVTYVYLSTHIKRCKMKKRATCYNKEIRKLREELDTKDDKMEKISAENKKLSSEIKILKTKNIKLSKNNKELEDDLLEQQGIVKGIQSAPDKRTIYNTNTQYVHPKLVNLPINNIRALTNEFIEERVNDGILTYEKAVRGYSGMLDIICEMITHENDEGIVERNYVCTDVSRNSFHRLLESKKWKSDKGGRYLNSMLDTFRVIMERYKNKAYDAYKNTPHGSMEWEQVEWERKNISLLYSGVVCKEGTGDREDLINALRKEIAKRASV